MKRGSLGLDFFSSIFLLIGNISYSWTEEMVNYFRVCAFQWWIAGFLILIEKERPGRAEGLRGGPLCVPHQSHMLYDRAVVELGLATGATTVAETVIYDITTPEHVKMIW